MSDTPVTDDPERGYRAHYAEHDHNRALCRSLEVQRDQYRQWVHDLQSGMYINCVYCGHRYGPQDEVPSTMADALKQHIEQCPKHPMSALRAEKDRLWNACHKINEEVCQVLGKALGYPWFKDDQKNFPGTTEVNGVCVGDHVAESIADEAADRIALLESVLAAAQTFVAKLDLVHNDPRYIGVWSTFQLHCGPYSGPQYSDELGALREALEKAKG